MSMGVGVDAPARGVAQAHVKPNFSTGKPGLDKKIAKRTGQRVIRRGEKR